jgi:inner membrane protein
VDPVTHGIVGVAAALSILAAWHPRPPCRTKWVALGCGFVAAELPDADRVIDACIRPFGPGGEGLAYMLYHRGLSHTVLGVLAGALVTAVVTKVIARRTGLTLVQLFAIAAAGIFLHLAMDGMNDYGIHPFHPVSGRWFYGDFLFLAEPTFAAALLPYVLGMLGVGRRVFGVSVLVGGVAVSILVLFHLWLTPFAAAVVMGWLVVQAWLQRKHPNPALAWGSVALVMLTFFGASRAARSRAVDWAAERSPSQIPSDIITTPAPGNPWCWRVITVIRNGDAFVVRAGVTSFLPSVDAAKCFAPPKGLVPSSVPCLGIPREPPCDSAPVELHPGRVYEFAEFTGSMSDFEKLATGRPRVGATRHFLRAPFWGVDAREGAREATLIGDLRVDYEPDNLGKYCKYSFPSVDAGPCPLWPGIGDPPFFVLPAP